MVPSSFVFLHALPLTANGKIDRRALARPETAEPVRDARRAVPHAPLEGQLVEICSRVLDIDGVDIHDNFFDLGGTSLHTVEIVTQAAELGLEVTPEMLFEHQTIAELAAALSVQGTSETDDA